MSDSAAPAVRPRPKPENIWLNLLCNIVVPALVLSKLSAEDRLGPLGALLVGLAFPLSYGIYDLIRRRKWNLFSGVGLVSVGLTGGLGLTEVEGIWFAVKEATIPLMLAIAVLATARSKRPLIRELLMNESITDVPRIEGALRERGTRPDFDRLLRRCNWGLAGSFLLSAVLNYVLARMIVTAVPGTPQFMEQIGRMTWVSYIVITVPSLAIMVLVLWRFFAGTIRLTGLPLESLLHQPPPKEKRHS